MCHGTSWTIDWIPRQVSPAAAPPATANELDQAINKIVHVADDLSGVPASTTDARLALDEVMRYYEYLRWTQD